MSDDEVQGEILRKADPQPREIEGMFSGPILPVLVHLAVPMLLGMVVQLVYNITDTVFISRIDLGDPSYVGGTGIVFPVIFLAMAVASGLSVGISSMVARAIGEKNDDILGKTAESGLIIAIIMSSILIILFYVFADQVLNALGAKGDYSLHAKEYLMFIIPAGVTMFVMHVFIGILQGEGLMKYVMVSMFIGTIGNIILDPILIFGLRMGVGGAALATAIAQTVAAVFIVTVFLKGKSVVRVDFKVKNISRDVMGKILSIGVPQTLSMIMLSFTFIVVNRIVVSIDPRALTSFSLTGRVDQIVLIPVFALSSAMIAMIGQNAGRGLLSRVREIWRTAMISEVVVVSLMAGMLFLCAPFIYAKFTDVEAVVRYAVLQTRIVEFSFVFAGLAILGRSTFQALGLAGPSIVVMILRTVAISIPSALILVFVFHLGLYGIWFGLIAGNVVSSVVGLAWASAILRKMESGDLACSLTTRS